MGINNQIGPPVESNNFFGRQKELREAWQLLETGHSLVLSAPRRVGKSSFAKKLLEQAGEADWKVMYIDVEAASTEKEFVKLFSMELNKSNIFKKAGEWLATFLSRIDIEFEAGQVGTKLSWKEKKEGMYDGIRENLNHEANTLIVIDELAIYLNFLMKGESGKESVEFFLNWLRSLRQAAGSKIRWIFCSSVGIDNFTSMHKLSYTLNDASAFSLGAYSQKEASELLLKLAESYHLTFCEGCLEHMLDRLGWWLPYFIQVMFYYTRVDAEDNRINKVNIDHAYEQQVNDNKLNSWDERLKEYGESEKNARIVLKSICTVPDGLTRQKLLEVLHVKVNDIDETEEILAEIIKILEHDGYLLRHEGTFRFRSPVLKDFWFKRFVE